MADIGVAATVTDAPANLPSRARCVEPVHARPALSRVLRREPARHARCLSTSPADGRAAAPPPRPHPKQTRRTFQVEVFDSRGTVVQYDRALEGHVPNSLRRAAASRRHRTLCELRTAPPAAHRVQPPGHAALTTDAKERHERASPGRLSVPRARDQFGAEPATRERSRASRRSARGSERPRHALLERTRQHQRRFRADRRSDN